MHSGTAYRADENEKADKLIHRGHLRATRVGKLSWHKCPEDIPHKADYKRITSSSHYFSVARRQNSAVMRSILQITAIF